MSKRPSFSGARMIGRLANRLLHARFWQDESGSYAILTAVLMPVLVGVAGLGTEAGLWLYKHQSLQSAADAGALSAATASFQGSTDLLVQAKAVTALHGFTAGLNNVTVTLNRPPQAGNHITSTGAVEVIVRQLQPRLFSAIWSHDPAPVSARAVAVTGAPGCLIALDQSASGAIALAGGANVNLSNCSAYDNSNSASAFSAVGGANMTALSVSITGNKSLTGGSTITASQGVSINQPRIADPYASVPLPSYSGCNQTNYSTSTTVTFTPPSSGVYVFCNGLSIASTANVTLNPGIYVIDRGSFSVSGGAHITGTNVTIVFTSSTGANWATMNIAGTTTVNLTAPASGSTAGMVLYADRSMPVNTAFTLSGSASQALSGVVYLPKASVTYSGSSSVSNLCTKMIVNQITFTGTSKLGINCAGVATKPFGDAIAMLVE